MAMMFCRIFAASRNLAHQFSVLGLFWARSGHQFPGFFASWTYFLNFRVPAGLLFCIMGPQGHTPLGAARPTTRQDSETFGKLSPGVSESSILRFRRRFKCHFSCCGPFPKCFAVLDAHGWGGGGDPAEKLERTRGATSPLHNANRNTLLATPTKSKQAKKQCPE